MNNGVSTASHREMRQDPLSLHDRSIRRPWIVLFASTAAVVMAGAWWLYQTDARRIRDDVYHGLEDVGALKAEQIQKWRLERQGDAKVAALNPLVVRAATQTAHAGLGSTPDTQLLTTLRATSMAYAYSNILLLAPDARPLIALNDPAGAPGQTTLAAVHEALAQPEPVLSNLFRGADGNVYVDVTNAVRDANGRAVAVIVLRTSADSYLYPLLTYWPTPSRTSTTILLRRDRDNAVVLNTRRQSLADTVAKNVPLTRTDVAAVQAVLGTRGLFDGLDHEGRHIVGDLRAVPGAPWFLITKIDAVEVQAAIQSRLRAIAIVAALSILLVGALTGYGYRMRQTGMFREMYAAERQEREAQAVFRTTLYSIADAVITTDAGGRITSMNRVAEQLTGWNAADAAGKSLDDVYRTVDEESLTPRADSPVPGQWHAASPDTVNHTLLLTSEAKSRPIASSSAPIVDDTGTNHGTVLVFRDQTAEREQQSRMLQSERMASMGRLAGGIAHDFNNLLSIIAGVTDVVIAKVPNESSLQSPLHELRSAATRAVELTRQLLTFSRQQVIRPQVVNLNDIVSNLRRMLVRLLGVRITLVVRQSSDAPLVLADAGQLEQIVMNLTLNARDAMPDGGTITVEISRVQFATGRAVTTDVLEPGHYVTLSVQDTGIGMDADTAQRACEPFFTTKEAGQGTGLGLATVHGIVQQAGGGLEVASVLGEGSTFTVYLPDAEARTKATTQAT